MEGALAWLSKRRTWRRAHLGLDANTGHVRAALMTHQGVADGDYDTKPCYAAIATRDATLSIPPREGAAHWPANTSGATRRNDSVNAVARLGRCEWKKGRGYRSLAENAMYRFKTLTGNCQFLGRPNGADR